MSALRRLLVATCNPHKLREIRNLLERQPLEICGLYQLGSDPDFAEKGESFEANSRAKALYYHLLHQLPAVADDSGLVIDALDGEPGVLSNRFLGEDTPYPRKMEAILERLSGVPEDKRGARFTCALSVAVGGRLVATITKHVFGHIAAEPRGSGGFGYDPIFYCPELGATFGEAPPEAKNRVSHRGKAISALAVLLETHNRLRTAIGLDPPGR